MLGKIFKAYAYGLVAEVIQKIGLRRVLYYNLRGVLHSCMIMVQNARKRIVDYVYRIRLGIGRRIID
jgi:hypothetical protein